MKIDELRRRFRRAPLPPEAAEDGHEGHTYANVDINGMLPDAQLVALQEAALQLGWPEVLEVRFEEGHFIIDLSGDTFRLPFKPSDIGAVVIVPAWTDDVRELLKSADKRIKGVKPAWMDIDGVLEGIRPSDYTLLLDPRDVDSWSDELLGAMRHTGWPASSSMEVANDVHRKQIDIIIQGPEQRAEIHVSEREIDAAMDHGSMGVVEVTIPAYNPIKVISTPPEVPGMVSGFSVATMMTHTGSTMVMGGRGPKIIPLEDLDED